MSTTVEVLSNMVYINRNGLEIGLPLEVVMEVIKHPKIQELNAKEGWDGKDDGYGIGYMQPRHCPNCGLVPSSTGTCGYCGSKCE